MRKIKAKKSSAEILEIIVVILLGITALLTAWASWIGSLYGGEQSMKYTESNNLSARGNADYNNASQLLAEDRMVWNQLNEARINYAYAYKNNDTDTMEKYEWFINQVMNDNISESFAKAIAWANEQDKQQDVQDEEDLEQASQELCSSPFDMPGYYDSYFTNANEELQQAQDSFEAGKLAKQHEDTFGLVTVIYSVVLFLLGIAGTFKSINNRFIIIIIAAVAFVGATVFMFTIPLPEDFSIFGFFQR